MFLTGNATAALNITTDITTDCLSHATVIGSLLLSILLPVHKLILLL